SPSRSRVSFSPFVACVCLWRRKSNFVRVRREIAEETILQGKIAATSHASSCWTASRRLRVTFIDFPFPTQTVQNCLERKKSAELSLVSSLVTLRGLMSRDPRDLVEAVREIVRPPVPYQTKSFAVEGVPY